MTETRDPETAREALARARQHGRTAAAEALAAVQALMDAGALVTSGEPARRAGLGPLVESLERARSWLDTDREGPILTHVLESLDGEVTRWETRSREDPDARVVLRAFLAVREVLWEVSRRGAEPRPGSEQESSDPPDAKPSPLPKASEKPGRAAAAGTERPDRRLRRVQVEG